MWITQKIGNGISDSLSDFDYVLMHIKEATILGPENIIMDHHILTRYRSIRFQVGKPYL